MWGGVEIPSPWRWSPGDALPARGLPAPALPLGPWRARRVCHARLCSFSRTFSQTTEAEISIKKEK